MKKLFFATLSLAAAISLNATVYATVDGDKIEDKDLAAVMGGNMVHGNLSQFPEDTKKQIINQAIEQNLLTKKAKKEGIEKTKDFKEALEIMKDKIALELYMKKVYDEIKVSDKEIKDFYDKNTDKFLKPAQAKIRFIMTKNEADVKKILDDLKNLKDEKLIEKFSQLAKEKSEDKISGAKGGEMPFLAKNQMPKPLADATFSMKKGEYSKTPIKIQDTFNIILKEDEKPAGKVKLTEAKAQIEGAVKMEKWRKQIADTGKKLREGAKVVYK